MNIIVDLNYPIKDGSEVIFRSPVDCSQVTGLLVNYQDNGNCSKEFAFADAHGNNVGDIDHLFAENVAVKVILDVTTGMAFVQNADTNAYLEGRMGRIAHPVTGDEFNGLALEEKLVPGDSYLITEDATTDDLVTKGKIFRAKDKVNFGYIMSVGGGGSTDSAVLYTEQELTPEQQTQARDNIGAVSAELFNITEGGVFDELTDIFPEQADFTEGKYCSYKSGNISDNADYSCALELIPFPADARLFCYYSASTTNQQYPVLCFYDENKNWIGGQYPTSDGTPQEEFEGMWGVFFNVLPDTRYIRISWSKTNVNNSSRFDKMFLYTVVEKEAQDSVKIPGLVLPKSKIEGENVVFFGDSIMGMYRDETSVANRFAEMTGANVYNVGFGGCRMSVHSLTGYAEFSMWALADAIYNENFTAQDSAASSGSAYFPDQVRVLKSIDFSTVDRAVIHYGTNDFTGNAQIDNAENPLDYATLCGALRYSLEKLLTKYPHLRIYVSLPTFRYWASDAEIYPDTHTNSKGNTLLEFIDAIADTAKEYNIPVIDGFHGLGVNKLNVTTFLEDGTHHNETGRMRLGHYLASCICAEL